MISIYVNIVIATSLVETLKIVELNKDSTYLCTCVNLCRFTPNHPNVDTLEAPVTKQVHKMLTKNLVVKQTNKVHVQTKYILDD